MISDEFPEGGLNVDYSVSCDLPDNRCSALMGENGEYIEFVQRTTGAQVQFDDAGSHENGARTMSVVGHILPVYIAHMLMMRRYLDIEQKDGRPPASDDVFQRRVGEVLHSDADADAWYDVESLKRLKRSVETGGYLEIRPSESPQLAERADRRSASHGKRRRVSEPRRADKRSRSRRRPSHQPAGDTSPGGGSFVANNGQPVLAGDGSGGHPEPNMNIEVEGGRPRCALTVWMPAKSGEGFKSFAIRGPKRKDRGLAQADGQRMLQAYAEGGEKDARKMQRTLQEENNNGFQKRDRPFPADDANHGEYAERPSGDPTYHDDGSGGVANSWATGDEGDEGCNDAAPGAAAAALDGCTADCSNGAADEWDDDWRPAVFIERVLGQNCVEDAREEGEWLVRAFGDSIPEPFTDWDDAVRQGLLAEPLRQALLDDGMAEPTLVQRHAMPVIASRQHDLILEACAGSGKSLAFAWALVSRLAASPDGRAAGRSHLAQALPLVLIICPTRELAIFAGSQLRQAAAHVGAGQGVLILDERGSLAEGHVDVVCATPGRLTEALESRKVSMASVQTVVLDEADQFFSAPHDVAVGNLLTRRDLPHDGRQTLLSAAAFSARFAPVAQRWLREAELAAVQAGRYADVETGIFHVEQRIAWVQSGPERWKSIGADLTALLQEESDSPAPRRAIVFVSKIVQATALCNLLQKPVHGLRCARIHGRLPQDERTEVVQQFEAGYVDVLVATNVAGRALDFADVAVVMLADLPPSIEAYAHRVGRAGRSGAAGRSLAYVAEKDRALLPALRDFLGSHGQEVPEWLSSAA